MIGIVIPFYNGDRFIDKCLSSIRNLKLQQYKVYVVNNSDKDTNIEEIANKYKFTTIIKAKARLGYARANNIGIERAILDGCKYVLIMNQDIIADENLLNEMKNAIDKDDDIWMAGPMQYEYDGNKLDPLFMKWYVADIEDIFEDAINCNIKKYYSANKITGACILIKKEMIDKIGAFDENYFMYGEDDDLCRKVKYSEKGIILVISAKISHNHSHALAKDKERDDINILKKHSIAIYKLKDTKFSFTKNIFKYMRDDICEYLFYLLSYKLKLLSLAIINDLYIIIKIHKIYISWKNEKTAINNILNK